MKIQFSGDWPDTIYDTKELAFGSYNDTFLKLNYQYKTVFPNDKEFRTP